MKWSLSLQTSGDCSRSTGAQHRIGMVMPPKASTVVVARKRTANSLATMAEQAYELIRHQVLHGELEPGSIVSERMLAERLHLGKAPIRSAVQRLASEGFI